MGIPESQLDIWSHQGSIAQSSATYNTIKNVLEAANTPYANKNYKVFLQGSYCNDTNIYAESDVDIVIKLNDCFRHDLSALPEDQQGDFRTAHSDAVYTHADFKRDVLSVLTDKYGGDVIPGDKAINIAANGSRRKTDVIVAVQYRRYYRFLNVFDQSYDEGICFFDSTGKCIANYPKQHSDNCTRKHQSSGKWFKPMVRILKNMRSKLVDSGKLAGNVAPSYFLEGLLYNAPDSLYATSYEDCFVNCINWIKKADKDEFVCANEQYYLLREGSAVTWRISKCDEFLAAVIDMWNQW